ALISSSFFRSGRASKLLHASTNALSRSGDPYLASYPSTRASAFCARGERCSKNIADWTFSGLRSIASYSSRKTGVSNHSTGTSVAALGIHERSLNITQRRRRSAATSKPALRRLTGATGRPRLGVGASGGAGGAAALVAACSRSTSLLTPV